MRVKRVLVIQPEMAPLGTKPTLGLCPKRPSADYHFLTIWRMRLYPLVGDPFYTWVISPVLLWAFGGEHGWAA